MRIDDFDNDELKAMFEGTHPLMRDAETDPWETAMAILRGAQLPLRRGMLLVNGLVVTRGEEGHEPREEGAQVRVCGHGYEYTAVWSNGDWTRGGAYKNAIPDIRDPWTARMVWHDLHARFAGEDRSKTPNQNQILALIVATGGYEKLTMDERKERHRAVVEEQQAARETGKGRTL